MSDFEKDLWQLRAGDKIRIDDTWRKITLNKQGYLVFQLNKDKVVALHRMVWKLLKGALPKDAVVIHKDGNKQNNHPDNLELSHTPENKSRIGAPKSTQAKGNVYVIKRVVNEQEYIYYTARLCHENKRHSKCFTVEAKAWEWLENLRLSLGLCE
jgi:hypothetical protein